MVDDRLEKRRVLQLVADLGIGSALLCIIQSSRLGMDVHQATTVGRIDAAGKIVLETIVATAAAPIRRLIESISGPLQIAFEETAQAESLYELLQGLVAEVPSTARQRTLDGLYT